MSRLYSLLFALAGVLALPALAGAQGVTTASMFGKVTDATGEPLIGATVVAVHEPSGSTYGNATDLEGFYRIPGMRVGGPYTVTVSYTGYETQDFTGIRLALGQTYRLFAELGDAAVELGGVEVVAARSDIFDPLSTGAETVIDEEQINALPTVSRSLGDYTRLTPQSTTREGNDGFELSFGGMNNRYNAIYIDGAVNNDVFGLAGSGTNGGQTGVSPISVDAIESIQVNLAPFDVRIGGFAGAAVSAITRSGTNETQASVYGFYRNENFTREEYRGATVAPFTAYTTGFRIGGPLIKDKLFYFVNAELQREETPLPFDFGTYDGDADRDDVNALLGRLEEFGYDPGPFEDNERFLNSDKVTAKFDLNANANNKLSLRLGYVGADNLEGVQSNQRNLNFLNSSERFNSSTFSGAFEWTSVINSNMSNDLTIGATIVRDDRDPNGQPFPYVRIRDGAGSITFGSERFSTANLLNQDVFTINNNFNIYKGNHAFTIGANLEFYSVDNLFLAFNYGEYQYGSLDEFLGGEPADFYQRSYSLVDNVSGDESEAIASFNSGIIGAYFQDRISLTENFNLTLGIRADLGYYGDTPGNEVFASETAPLIEAAGYDLEGATIGDFISPRVQLSPRVGFNWDVNGDRTTQLRGGVGIFTSRAPLVWVGGAYNNYGFNTGYTRSFNATFNPDINTQLPGEVDLSNVEPSGSVDLFSEDFVLPQFLKFNVAADQKLPFGFVGTIDLMFNKTINNVAYQNLNVVPSDRRLAGTGDDRIIYNGRDDVDPTYGRVILGTNTSEGYTYNVSAQLTKPFENGLSGTLAYSYGDAYSVFDGTSSQNSSQWRGLTSVNGRNIDQPLTRSVFAMGSRFIAGLSYEIPWAGDLAKTTFTIFSETAQNRPYTFTIGDGGDLTGEDSRDRAPFYVPTDADDIFIGTVVDDDDDRDTPTIFTPDPSANAELQEYIDGQEYLSERRGQYTENNALFGPWATVLDLRVIQDFGITIGENRHAFQATLDVFNFTNLLNEEWGQRRFYGGQTDVVEFEGFLQGDALTSRGFSEDARVPVYSFNSEILEDGEIEPFYDDSGIQSSRWQAQVGLRYLFN